MCHYECGKRAPSQKLQCCGHQKADTCKGDPKWYSVAQQSFLLCGLRPSFCSWERLIVVAESSWHAISSISISSRNIIGKPYEIRPVWGPYGSSDRGRKNAYSPARKAYWSTQVRFVRKIKKDDWVRSVLAGKIFDSRSGRTARTSLPLVHTSWPCAKYFLVRPSYWINRNIFLPYSQLERG